MLTIPAKNPDVVSRTIADEFILVPIRQRAVDLKSIFTLNETAACVWQLIDGKRDIPQISACLAETFEVDTATARQDVQEIIAQLETLQLIRES